MRRLSRWALLLCALPFLLGVNERYYEPLWSTLYNALPVQGYPHCFAFKAWRRNTGPVTLASHFLHIGELVKPAKDGWWRSLDSGDIVVGQLVTACLCGDIFVLVPTTQLHDDTLEAICHDNVS